MNPEPPSKTKRRWRRAAAIWLLMLALLYAGGVVFLWATQDSRVFIPHAMDTARADAALAQVPGAKHVWLSAGDGTRLHAWWHSATPGKPSGKVVLYFGGNAEDVHWRLGRVAQMGGWDVLLVDYRGYGLSAGRPSQADLQIDALLWHDKLAGGKLDSLPKPAAIAVMGTSLGSYFAAHVAAQRQVAAVVLATPFDSVRSYIQSRMPVVPIGLILRHPLHSLGHAGSVQSPTLFLVAEQDNVFPPETARRLFEAWASPTKEWVLVPQANHNTASAQPAYWQSLERFLRGRS
jgi:uncharacterized protein